MPQPTGTDVYVSELLSDTGIGFMNEEKNFVHEDAMAVVPCPQAVSKYKVHTREDWLRIVAAARAPGTESHGSGWGQSFASTQIDDISVHKDITYEDYENSPDDEEEAALRWCVEQIKMKAESNMAAELFTNTKWASANRFTGVTSGPGATGFLQADQLTADPVGIVRSLSASIGKVIGRQPNRMLFGVKAWNDTTRNSAVRDDIKHVGLGTNVSETSFASACGLEKVLVSRVANVTSAEGATTATNAYIATESSSLLYYASPLKDTKNPSACYSFTLAPKNSLLARTNGFYVRVLPPEATAKERVIRIEAGLHRQFKVTSDVAGIHCTNWTST